MRVALRWGGYLLAGLLVLAMIAAAYVWFASSRKLNQELVPRPESLVPMAEASLEQGQHLLLTRACVECHGADLRGTKLLDDAKVATVYATNLTNIARNATDQQLAQAIRQGISHDGRPLLIMPSESYAAFTDAETSALIKAIRALPAGGEHTAAPKAGPLGRIGIVAGQLKLAPELVKDYAAAPPVNLGPQHAAGRHIAVTVCSGCHGSNLGGREPEPGTVAPDLVMTGAYDLPAFTRLLRTGLPPDGRELKMMTRVSREAFRYFTDQEIAQLHAYLVERAQRAQ